MRRGAQYSEGVRARVSPEMLAALHRRARQIDAPVSDIVRFAIEGYLAEKPAGLVRGRIFA
jgi:hypothetical protein